MPEAEVVTVPVTLQVPKESKELVDCALAIVEHFKNGGDVAGAALLLPAVLSAVEGVDKVVGEAKSHANDELAGYVVQKVLALVKPKAAA